MNTAPVLHYYDLGRDVLAFSTTRVSGVGKGQYASFNINGYCGDDPADVAANRRALCSLLGIQADRLVMPHQTHGTNVLHIDNGWKSLAPHARQELLQGVDALMTDAPGLCIGVSTADCIPVIIYDGPRHAACVVHAGWRGTVARITAKAVRCMCDRYGSDATKLRAVIGPGISQGRFEVGDEVYDQFAAAGFDMRLIAERQDKWHVDLWQCNRLQLTGCGIPDGNIQLTAMCTYDDPQKWFSARRQGVASGRIFTAVLLA